jgi:hypothetical protein
MWLFANFITVKPIDVTNYRFSTSPILTLICVIVPFLSIAIPGQNKSPISFIENKGQIIDQYNKHRKDIDFKFSASGMNVFIGKGQIHYQWNKLAPYPPKGETHDIENGFEKHKSPLGDLGVETYRMDVALIGANVNAELITAGKQNYYENFYLPQCPNGTRANTYNKIVYKNVYPNIDWVLYSKDAGLKYDFIIHPGGNPADIKLRYDGATDLKLKGGTLSAITPFGNITEQAPYSYEIESGRLISSSFALEGNELSFRTEPHNGTLIIDPKILWATYLGGSGTEYTGAITEDSFGHIYLAGCTNSTSNIATSGVHQGSYAAGSTNTYDAFLAKYTTDDTLLWSTYYGGEGIERGSSVACDPSGNVFLSGETGIISTTSSNTNGSLTGLATAGAHQTGYAGRGDVFLAKFDSTGVRQWGTYFGGSDVDDNGVLTCDDSGNVYMAGWTLSTDSISTQATYQATHAGTISATQYDGFIEKFNGAGVRQWGTYYGGDSMDRIESIAYDRTSACICVGGYTMSINNILASGANGNISGLVDGFISLFFAEKGTLKTSMYYGGTGSDAIYSITCDKSGNIYVGGITNSDNNIVSGNSYQSSRGGGWDAFVGKINAQGQRQWGTYLGGSADEEMWGVCTDAYGNLYPAIRTSSTSGLPTANGFQTSNAGMNDAHIAAFGPDGFLFWASYYGGTGDEDLLIAPGYGNANILFSKKGNLFTCGNTTSQSGISSGTAHQSTYGGGSTDVYLAKIYCDTTVEIIKPFIDTLKCVGDSMYVTIRTSNYFRAGNVFTVQLSDSSGNFSNPTIIGAKTSIYDGDIITHIPNNQIAGAHYKVRVLSTSPKDTSDDDGRYIRISQYPEPSASSNAPVCEGASLDLFVSSPIPVNDYLWLGPDGFISTNFFPERKNIALTSAGKYIVILNNYTCKAKDSIDVFIKPRPAKPHIISNDSSFCVGDSLMITTAVDTGISFTWQTPQGYFPFSSNTRTIADLSMSDSGMYRLATIFNYNSCPSVTDSLNIAVHPIPVPVATVNSPVCSGEAVNIKVADTTYQVAFTWIGPNGFASTTADTIIHNSGVSQSGDYVVIANAFNCIGTDTVTLLVKQTPAKPQLSSNSPVCSGEKLELKATDSIAAVNYSWLGPNGFNAITQNTAITTASTNASGRYKATAAKDGCTSADSIDVTIKPTPVPDLASNSPVTIGDDLYLQIQNPQSAYSYLWKGPDGFASTSPNPVLKQVTVNAAGTYTLMVADNGCTGTATINIDIKAPDTNYFVLYPNPNNGKFTIKGYVQSDQIMPVRIFDAGGKLLYKEQLETVNRIFKQDISLPSAANGVYLFQIKIDRETKNLPFTIGR